jgi:hypothetical protein
MIVRGEKPAMAETILMALKWKVVDSWGPKVAK